MAKRWSDKEINFLKNNYDKYSNPELSKILNRTIGSIERKATLYNLHKIEYKKESIHKETIAYIKQNYGNKTAKEIALELNIDISIIESIIYRNHLTKTNNHYGKALTRTKWTDNEIDFLKNNYDKLQQKDIALILNKTVTSIQKKMEYLSLKKYTRNDNWTTEETAFLKDNYHNTNCKEIAIVLNRTENSVRAKAVSLKLYKDFKETHPEMIVRNILTENNIKFSSQVNIRGFIADFVLENNIIIEVQGDYWHCNPKIYDKPKNETQKRKIQQDKLKKRVYEKLGFKVLYLWEYDLENNYQQCINDIVNVAVLGQNSQKTQDD